MSTVGLIARDELRIMVRNRVAMIGLALLLLLTLLLLNQLEQGHLGIGHRRLHSGSSSHPNPTEDRRWLPHLEPPPTPPCGALPVNQMSMKTGARAHVYTLIPHRASAGGTPNIELERSHPSIAMQFAQRELAGREIELLEDGQPLGTMKCTREGYWVVLPRFASA